MALQTPVLTKSFIADAPVPARNLALVMSAANAGNIALPAAAGAGDFIGVSDEPSDRKNALAVVMIGIAQIQSDGSAVITAGDAVQIAGPTGQIKTGATKPVGMALGSAPAVAGVLVDVLLRATV